VEEAPWIRAKSEGFLGLWHVRAGQSNRRQGVQLSTERTPLVTPDDMG
jgi:hypothetical protein